MKTLCFINCTDTGSTGKIINDIAAVAKAHGFRSFLCTPNVTQPDKPYLQKLAVSCRLQRAVVHRLSKLNGNRYGMGRAAAHSIIRLIRKEKVDLVHMHCANGSFLDIYYLLDWLKHNNIPTVVTNHAEFFYTGNCDHAYDCDHWKTGCGKCPQRFSVIDSTAIWWKKMKRTFSDYPCLVVTSVSPWVHARSAVSPIMEGVEQTVICNGVNTDVFHPYAQENVWEQLGVQHEGKRIILYVTAHFYGNRPEKGSMYLLQLAERFACEDVIFAVAGSYRPDVQVPSNIVLLGRIADQQQLAQLYSAADLTLITSQRETFSMPVAESLCCGTPVVGFRAGGPESIAPEEFAEFTPFGDVDALENAIRGKWLHFKNAENASVIEELAKKHFSSENMAAAYISIYKHMTGEAK